jgi:hypothetical protein
VGGGGVHSYALIISERHIPDWTLTRANPIFHLCRNSSSTGWRHFDERYAHVEFASNGAAWWGCALGLGSGAA